MRWKCIVSTGMLLALGITAAALTIASFLAQTWKILRTRDTKSLSTPMWILSMTAFAIWVCYGAMLADWALVVPNAMCCVLAGFILMLKLLPRTKRDSIADKLSADAKM